ncbi:lipopolysaccharide core heptose(II) kinase RfaY [Helicobacter sp. MIT 05-5294]|uniref:lipopolysaccharide core heptose(II) kinase RfaY n=1 Tax=Helicobacter sp. MIT 05-5294 TaxID=1548150 RepID=UPI0010FD0F5A|nr:lipopolysaccharide core heptose(II) kinase RfaY [Helicobacter sp. MIT 05-5294]TLD85914.1 heptose kinase [Helicobacter sp. MIT 05-5294]
MLKASSPNDRILERFIKFLFRGDYYLNSFKAIQRIRNEGCYSPNDFYLLAENKVCGIYPKDFIMIYEYIEGEPYLKQENNAKFKEKIKIEIEKLHSHNFVFGGDINRSNILLSCNQIRFIDIEGKLPSRFNKAEDRISMEKFLGIPNTNKDFGYLLATLKRNLRKIARKIKGKS